MRFTRYSSSYQPNGMPVMPKPYNSFVAGEETDINPVSTMPLAPSLVFPIGLARTAYTGEAKNISTGGQQVRIGVNPTFTATAQGLLLNPGDSVTYIGYNLNISAVANAAGAVISRQVVHTS